MDFIRKKWGIPIRDIWFNYSHNTKSFSLFNIAYNLYNPLSEKCFICKRWESQTFISDISVASEEMMKNFKSKVRNEIRRAVREGITTKWFEPQEMLEGEIIDAFDKAYLKMYQDKGQNANSIASRLRGIAKARRLGVSVAYLSDGTIAAYHSYVIGDRTARLLHSVSCFREEADKRKMIGWANRLLHYNDMCTLKKSGINFYDWGGLSREKHLENITRFKEEFGGIEKTVYYYIFFKGD